MSKYIKQDKAIKIVESHYRVDNDLLEVIAYQISNLPPEDVQPVVQWIPCSERLPEKYGNYLVTTDDGEVDIGSCDPENKDRQDHFWSGCDADGFFWYGENIVIAWMPLPEPYKEGEQDERMEHIRLESQNEDGEQYG